MSSRIGSTVATFLLSVPISAAGLVFGMPYLNQVINSPEAENVIRDPEALSMFRDMVRGQNEDSHASEFAELNSQNASPWEDFPGQKEPRAQSESNSSHQHNAWADQLPPQQPPLHADWNQQQARSRSLAPQSSPQQYLPEDIQNTPRRHDQPQQHVGGTQQQAIYYEAETEASSLGNLPPASSGLSWREASRQLNELGIKKYHLERGHEDGAFLFVCLFAPGDAPEVTHRFESEAADPLLAVNQVLQQINSWLATRYSAQRNTKNARTL